MDKEQLKVKRLELATHIMCSIISNPNINNIIFNVGDKQVSIKDDMTIVSFDIIDKLINYNDHNPIKKD